MRASTSVIATTAPAGVVPPVRRRCAPAAFLVALLLACGEPTAPVLEVTLTSGPTFAGTVTLADAPQPGVVVRGHASRCEGGGAISEATTTTGRAGTYTLVLPLSLGASDLCIQVSAEGTGGVRIIGFHYEREDQQLVVNLDERGQLIAYVERPEPVG